MATAGSGYASAGSPATDAGNLLGLPNVTALRNHPGGAAKVVALRGYSNPNQSDQGTFQWDPNNGVDDGVTRFNKNGFGSNESGWQRMLEGPLTLWMGGAIGDGVTDDTDAIQRVLDAAANSNTSTSDVYVPPNTFLVSKPLTFVSTTTRGLTLYGAGWSSVLNIVLVGANTSGLASSGVISNLQIRDLKVTGVFTRAFDLRGAGGGNNVRVSRCDISGATAALGGTFNAGIVFAQTDDVWIEENYLHDNGTVTQNGADIYHVDGVNNKRVHIRNNRVQGHACPFSIALFDLSDSDVMGNYVDQNNIGVAAGGTGYGILVYSIVVDSQPRIQISNNYVTNTAGNGIYCANVLDAVISDNLLNDVCKTQTEVSLPKGGISFNGLRGTIVGNLIQQSAQSGIVFTGNYVAVVGNECEVCAIAGVHVQGAATPATISGNVIRGCLHGILTDVGSTPEGLAICDNVGTGQGAGAGGGILIGGAANFCTCTGNYFLGFQDNIYWNGGAQNTIVGNVLRAAAQDNLDYRGANSIIANNICQNAAVRGIFESGAQNNILNNVCNANGVAGVAITGANSWGEKNRVSAAGPMTGLAVLGVGGTVVVATAEIQAGDTVRITPTVAGGVQGQLSIAAIIAGTSFTINSNSAADTSTVFWEIIH